MNLPHRVFWIVFAAGLVFFKPEQRRSDALRHDVYVWQRRWSEPVVDAVTERSSWFSQAAFLAAEASWDGKQPRVVRPTVHFETLARLTNGVTPTLRLGPFRGPFHKEDENGRFVAALAASVIQECRSNGLHIAEFQIDFDCAESKLAGYALWLEAIRSRVGPVRLVVTALPSWLNRSGFGRLVRTADAFVLQVHSLDRPKHLDAPFTLCDPRRAVAWVERAAHFEVPFRVALPTYGYLVAFDPGGAFVGLRAEGPALDWPPDVEVRPVRANAAAMATLIRRWQRARPARMEGVIWYRLPIEADRLNWSWTTLQAVMEGDVPVPSLKAGTREIEPGLVEIEIVNDGRDVHFGPASIHAGWERGAVVACDGLRGFTVHLDGARQISFEHESLNLEPGQAVKAGWVRFENTTEIAIIP